MINRGERLRADLSLLLVAAIWGSAFVSQRLSAQTGSVFMFNGLRYLIAAVAIAPFVKFKGNFDRAHLKWIGAAGFVVFAGSSLQQAGLRFTTASNAGFLTSLYVVFVPFFIFLIWRERLHWLAISAVIVSALGAYLLSTGGVLRFQIGDSLELTGALFWALHVIIVGKFASQFDPLAFSFGQFMAAGLINTIIGLVIEHPDAGMLMAIAPHVLYVGIFSVGVGYTLQVRAQRHTPPTDAALILSLEAIFAVFFGWIVLRESLQPIQVAGCALILIAVVLAQARPAPPSSS
jgi:drug/metabolite transporter (DMT)-like permease